MNQAGPSRTITLISRNGSRKKEFDSFFYMRDDQRRQYLLDRYLKRLPVSGDLNTAMERRRQYFLEVGSVADTHDNEDLLEAVQRGWIDNLDLAKYYKPDGKKDPRPLLKSEEIVFNNSEIRNPKKNQINVTRQFTPNRGITDLASLDSFLKKLEKSEKVKKTNKLLTKGFADLSIKGKGKSVFKDMERASKRQKNVISKIIEDPKNVKKDKPMWKKKLDAENYDNDMYIKRQKMNEESYKKGKIALGKTREEHLIATLEELNINDTTEKKKRSAIFLDDIKQIKRKRSISSNSSRKSSISVSSRNSSVKSVGGYSSPGSSPKSSRRGSSSSS